MKKSILLSVAGLTLLSTLGFTLGGGARTGDDAVRSSFSAEVIGDISATTEGEAEFGVVQAGPNAAPTMSVSLGARSGSAAVVFSRVGSLDLPPGVYQVSEEGSVRALVVTGTPTRPTGVFRAQQGVLTVTQASDKSISGEFQLEATGFRASHPMEEDRRVSISGNFTALPAAN
ncbi:MAG TPA: hypothetical protein VFB61_14055 [Gemmatimonadales bacterium]|nr:hypothetical protein [Gemmatimonadales bacterium]